MTWQQAENVLIPMQLLFAMFGMGATMAVKEFAHVARHPAGVSIGVGLQWLVVPLMGWALIHLCDLQPGWAVGILLVTVTPGGAFSNLLTYLARGHTALSIAVTAVATLASIVTAPTLLRIFASQHLPADFTFPAGRILYEVGVFLLAPLAAGILVHRYLNAHSSKISKASIWLSMSLVVTIAAGALTTGRIKVVEFGWQPPLMIFLFALAIHHMAAEVSWLLKRFDDETVALAIEVSVRNGGVGLLLLQFFFQGQPEQGHALYAILFYTGLQIWVPIPAILRHRARRSPLFLRAPRPRPRASDRPAGAEGTGGSADQ